MGSSLNPTGDQRCPRHPGSEGGSLGPQLRESDRFAPRPDSSCPFLAENEFALRPQTPGASWESAPKGTPKPQPQDPYSAGSVGENGGEGFWDPGISLCENSVKHFLDSY